MAPKEMISVLALVSSLLVLAEVQFSVSALKDAHLLENSEDSTLEDTEITEKDLPVLLLGYLLTRHGKTSPGSLTQNNAPYSTVSALKSKPSSNFTPILSKLLSSMSGHQQAAAADLPSQQSTEDAYQVMVSKRGVFDHISGVMPPLNEFCRMMKVQCY